MSEMITSHFIEKVGLRDCNLSLLVIPRSLSQIGRKLRSWLTTPSTYKKKSLVFKLSGKIVKMPGADVENF